jgi:polysaccharide export outer membrane protein
LADGGGCIIGRPGLGFGVIASMLSSITGYSSGMAGRFCAGVLALALAACNPFPSSGPNELQVGGRAVQTTPAESDFRYELVQISPLVTDVLAKRGAPLSLGSLSDTKPSPLILVRTGDVVGLSIFEASAGGLFIPNDAGSRAGNFVQLPNQTVDQSGNISVPYAGQVPASGKTLKQIEDTIVERLRNRAIEPQAVATIVDQRSGQIAILGDVNAPTRYALGATGDRMLDAIAKAGGPRSQGWQSWVTLQRDGRKFTVNFLTLVSDPKSNIYVRPGDVLYLYAEQRSFVVVGATGVNGQINFDAERLSLTEAIGKSGGLLDDRANPGATYLFRMEDRATLNEMGVDLSAWPPSQKSIPVVYHANLSNGGEYLLGTRVPMKNKDVLFVSNAATVEIAKVIQFIRLGTAGVKEVYDTKNVIR